jgi:hypothetical protein
MTFGSFIKTITDYFKQIAEEFFPEKSRVYVIAPASIHE